MRLQSLALLAEIQRNCTHSMADTASAADSAVGTNISDLLSWWLEHRIGCYCNVSSKSVSSLDR